MPRWLVLSQKLSSWAAPWGPALQWVDLETSWQKAQLGAGSSGEPCPHGAAVAEAWLGDRTGGEARATTHSRTRDAVSPWDEMPREAGQSDDNQLWRAELVSLEEVLVLSTISKASWIFIRYFDFTCETPQSSLPLTIRCTKTRPENPEPLCL